MTTTKHLDGSIQGHYDVAGQGHVRTELSLLSGAGTAANLTTDAQIAAIAMEHSGTVYSTDTDFARFPAVRSVNPLS